tara:strand:- start:701 stop:1465 length:765 start_codon:yes stop_codon:yes gene_type:complete
MTYPGFSEMLTGYVDPAISSNRLVTSKSSNVLEFLNSQQNYKDKVAVFATSDLFPYLLDRKQSKLYINADTDTLDLGNTESTLINSMQRMISKPTTERPDILTYFSAIEYIKHKKPKVLYLALGETDAFGHAGSYDQYLETAHTEDNFIKQLWEMLQAMPEYHDKTTLLITCDHGRGGQVPTEWTSHGAKITDSGQIWLAALGPNIPSTGELRVDGQIYQAQIAATIAQILGYRYEPTGQGVYKPISGIVKAKN